MAIKKKGMTNRPAHSGFEGVTIGRDVPKENIRFNKDGTYDIIESKEEQDWQTQSEKERKKTDNQ